MYYSGHVCAGESLWVPREMEVEGVVSLRMVVGAGVLDWGPYDFFDPWLSQNSEP